MFLQRRGKFTVHYFLIITFSLADVIQEHGKANTEKKYEKIQLEFSRKIFRKLSSFYGFLFIFFGFYFYSSTKCVFNVVFYLELHLNIHTPISPIQTKHPPQYI